MITPLEIGVTGGIGSGKSIVCKIFKSLGVSIYNSDDRAKYLIAHDAGLQAQIKKEFSNRIKEVNRESLRVFFSQPKLLKKLNTLVHPVVLNDYKKWKIRHQKEEYTIKEAALIIETGLAKKLDKLIVISAPVPLRIKRVQVRDPYREKQEIYNIIKNQMEEQEKLQHADYIIVNDNKQLIMPRVLALHRLFTSMKKNKISYA